MTTLADDLVPDELWALVEPLLPAPPRPPYGGRHRTISDRACVAALVFMARASTPWALLPAKELGCGSATTCWRRLDEWARAGVFEQLQALLLWTGWVNWVSRTGRGRAWTRPACTPSVGGPHGRNPVDRGKPGSKLHLVCDSAGRHWRSW